MIIVSIIDMLSVAAKQVSNITNSDRIGQAGTIVPPIQRVGGPFSSFTSAVLAAFSLTTVTEFGDRTFLISAVLAAANPHWIVLIGSSLALIVQTIFSTVAGKM